MTRIGANNLLTNLRTYYPRAFIFKSDAEVSAKVTDYETSLSKWDDETALKAACNWHLEHSESPTVADLIRECKLLDMEKKPYTPLPKPEPPKACPNPWQKAIDKYTEVHKIKPDDPHNFLFYVLSIYGVKEYMRCRNIAITVRNRRNDQNKKWGLGEDDTPTEATFASEEERLKYVALYQEETRKK